MRRVVARVRLVALQWSRGLSTTDNPRLVLFNLKRDLLQWSRGLSTTDKRATARGETAADLASMEPRSFNHG